MPSFEDDIVDLSVEQQELTLQQHIDAARSWHVLHPTEVIKLARIISLSEVSIAFDLDLDLLHKL